MKGENEVRPYGKLTTDYRPDYWLLATFIAGDHQ